MFLDGFKIKKRENNMKQICNLILIVIAINCFEKNIYSALRKRKSHEFEELQNKRQKKYDLNISLIDWCKKGDIEKVKMVLNLGANVNCIDENGYTPLFWALQKNNKRVIKTLKEAGATLYSKKISGDGF